MRLTQGNKICLPTKETWLASPVESDQHVIKFSVNCGDNITTELQSSLGVSVEESLTCRWISGGSQPHWRRPPRGATSASSWRTLSSDLSCLRTSMHKDSPTRTTLQTAQRRPMSLIQDPPGVRKMVTLATISYYLAGQAMHPCFSVPQVI